MCIATNGIGETLFSKLIAFKCIDSVIYLSATFGNLVKEGWY